MFCRKNLTMNEIHDIHGLRVIVENEEDCYEALRIVHQLWPEVQGKLKDYISKPKLNGYFSKSSIKCFIFTLYFFSYII